MMELYGDCIVTKALYGKEKYKIIKRKEKLKMAYAEKTSDILLEVIGEGNKELHVMKKEIAALSRHYKGV